MSISTLLVMFVCIYTYIKQKKKEIMSLSEIKKKTEENWILGREENNNYKLSLYVLLKLKKDLKRNVQ